MKKSLLGLSLVASIVLFTGCGGSSSSDTTAPKFTNTTTKTLDEGTSITIDLKTDDKDAVFSGDGVNGSKLKYSAPLVDTDTVKTVTVTATDKAGNSTTQVFTFNIKDILEVKKGYIATLGNKSFTRTGDDLKGPSGLVWRDSVPNGILTYSAAQTYCTDGFRLPTPSEVLDVIIYDDTTIDTNSTLLDDDFTNNTGNDANGNAIVSGVWVKTNGKNGNHHYVHTVGGVDALETQGAEHSVLCVKGTEKALGYTLTVDGDNITDKKTGYIWKKVSGSAVAFDNASCPAGFELPNINELRSIYDYSTYTFPSEIVPSGITSLWSGTVDPKKSTQIYIMQVDQNSSMDTDAKTNTHNVICVKKS